MARAPCPVRRTLAGFLLAGLAAVLAARPAAAQQPEADGLFLTVPNPITQEAVDLLKTKVAYAFDRQGRRPRTLVFDFNPTGPAGTGEDGPCITLKNYLFDLWQRRVKLGNDYPPVNTVAFVHGEVSKHTVLPVLACAELVMSRDGSLGDVRPRGSAEHLSEEALLAYRKVAEKSRWGDLVLRMLDENLVVRKVRTAGGGVAFWSQATLDRRRARGEQVAVEPGVPAGLEPGSGVVRAETAFRYGLAREVLPGGKRTAVKRADVAAMLHLPLSSVREEWLPEQAVPFRVDVSGMVDAGRLESLKRRISSALHRGANVLVLNLACEGGETVDVASAARWLKGLAGPGGPVTTIAYVPPGKSLGAGTFLALGCSQIVMGPGSALGDFEALQDAPDAELKPKREMLADLAEDQGYPPLLFRASLSRDLDLYHARTRAGVWEVITKAQKDEDDARPAERRRWQAASHLGPAPGHFLKLDAALAKQCGVAVWADVDSPEELYRRYDLRRVEVSRDDWLDRVAQFFREPVVNVLLIMLGIAGLILELKMPGLGFPGVVAGVCFVLFFWAHSFVGQFTMLAVLLFVLGLVLIGVEVFVTPGFGVMGVSGVVLLVGSLVLVTLERMPETPQDWAALGTTLGTFVASLLGAAAVAFSLAYYLPHIPYANRLILAPPGEGEGPEAAPGAGLAQAPPSLLGAIGEAATPLRPSGKARFGDDYLDVVSEGDYVNPGSRVRVVEIEGNRIVVKEV